MVFVFKLTFLLQDKTLSNGIFFLELLSAVEPRVVDWSVVTKGETGRSTFLILQVQDQMRNLLSLHLSGILLSVKELICINLVKFLTTQ